MRRLLLALIILFFAPVTHAVNVSILDSPSQISDDPFYVTIEVESASSGTNYLRIDLYKEGTKNYFGETDNGSYWYGGTSGIEYFPITLVGSVPQIATVSARLGTPTLTDYPGPDSYLLRVRRYTSGGNQGSEAPVPVPIEITFETPTPTPTSTPTPTPTPTPVPTPTPTPKPSIKPSPPAPSVVVDEVGSSPSLGTVAGESIKIDLSGFGISPSPSPALQGQALQEPTLNRSRAKTAIIVGSGLLLISLASFFGYRKYLIKHKDDTMAP